MRRQLWRPPFSAVILVLAGFLSTLGFAPAGAPQSCDPAFGGQISLSDAAPSAIPHLLSLLDQCRREQHSEPASDNCAVRRYEKLNPESLSGLPWGLQRLEKYCRNIVYEDTCTVALYKLHKKDGTPRDLSTVISFCVNPENCATRLNALQEKYPDAVAKRPPTSTGTPPTSAHSLPPAPSAPTSGGVSSGPKLPVPVPAPTPKIPAPTPKIPAPTATPARSAPAASAERPTSTTTPPSEVTPTPKPPIPSWFPGWISIVYVATILLLLALLCVFVALSGRVRDAFSWRAPSASEDSTAVRFKELEARCRKLEAKLWEWQNQLAQTRSEFAQYKKRTDKLSSQLEQILSTETEADIREAVSEREVLPYRVGAAGGNPPGFLRRAFGDARLPVRDGGAELAQAGKNPARALLDEYDEAIRGDARDVKAFMDKWGVFGLAKTEGQSGSGGAVLERVTEKDPQQWRFWAIDDNTGVTKILPGRYLYMHASSSSADMGRAGDRLYGEVFSVGLGAEFNLRNFAKARENSDRYEICEKGELQLAGSSGSL
jgi:hypothetical protein